MTVQEAAKIFHKDPNWIRAGIIAGWLPIGVATRKGEKVTDISKMNSRYGRINYFISDELVYRFMKKGADNETGSI